MWFAISTQSLGGGASTLYLMRLLLVERRRWVTQREYLEDWALSRLSPGIHMVAFAGLLGRRILGGRGTAISVLGLMVPAAAITAALTSGYDLVRGQALVQAALSGIGPVTIGLTIGITWVFAVEAARRGRRAVLDWTVLVASGIAGSLAPSPIVVIAAGAVIGALMLGRDHKVPRERAEA